MNISFEKILEERGIKPTAMRLLVLQELSKQDHAVDLNELELLFSDADRITLYRTLKTFLSKKLIHLIEDGTGSQKYALCKQHCECALEDSHIHFHCTQCKNTYCLDHINIPPIDLPDKFALQGMNIVLKGICEHCNPVA